MAPIHSTSRTLGALTAVALLLAACGSNDRTDTGPAGTVDAPLPQPSEPSGAITGMPTQPGPGAVPIGGEPPAPSPLPGADARFGVPVLEENPEAGLDAPDPTGREPAAEDAIAVILGYYAAIAEGDYARAHALWSDAGRGSGQTLAQFTAGFAQTASVEMHPGQPGAVEAAAGSRYIEVPVTVSAVHRDGSRHDYIGHYVLRRAVVDGASAEQRAWRIASADLREVAP